MLTRAALSLFIALFSASCTNSPAASEESRSIVGGSATTDYPAVANLTMQITETDTGRELVGACSATLISPRVLLTAAHCLDSESGTTTAVTAYFGNTIHGTDPGFIEEIEASDWTFFEPWSLSGNDIALVLLSQDSSVEPLPYNTEPLTSSNIGSSVHLVGWGNTSTSGGQGTKRHVTSSVAGFYNEAVVLYGNSQANTCQGDSGGPGFMMHNGEEKVTSVTSWGTGECLGESGGTRVARYADWIDSWVKTHDVAEPPKVAIVEPIDQARVKAGFRIFVEATDNDRVESVEIWINGVKERSLVGNQPPFVVTAPDLPDGTLEVEARAFDNRGDMSSATVTVTLKTTCASKADCEGVDICTDEGVCEAPNLALGETCTETAECSSQICATVADESRCSETCNPQAENSCTEGYECRSVTQDSGLCWPETSSGGCSSHNGKSSIPMATLLLLVAIALPRKRRSSQNQ